jgi:hypothetical protein
MTVEDASHPLYHCGVEGKRGTIITKRENIVCFDLQRWTRVCCARCDGKDRHPTIQACFEWSQSCGIQRRTCSAHATATAEACKCGTPDTEQRPCSYTSGSPACSSIWSTSSAGVTRRACIADRTAWPRTAARRSSTDCYACSTRSCASYKGTAG